MASPAPPRWMTSCIARCLPAAARDAVLGDLAEQYSRRYARSGRAEARRWYRRQALAFLARVSWQRWLSEPLRHAARSAASAFAASGRDIGFAARSLRARPGFALPALALFTVAIGANALVFSIVDPILFEDPPYPAADRLAMIWDVDKKNPDSAMPISYEHYLEWATRDDLFSAVGAYENDFPTVRIGDTNEQVNAMGVSADAWRAFGVDAALGRVFTPDDDTAGAAPVAVLSHRYWQSRLGGDPQVVGRKLEFDGKPTEIVGVMPEDFWFFDPYMFRRSSGDRQNADAVLWTPLRRSSDWNDPDRRSYPALRLLVRLRPGITVTAAAQAIETMRTQLEVTDGRTQYRGQLTSLSEQMRAARRPHLLLALACVAAVLLIACANVVSLVFARSSGRQAELAVRHALGASRWQLGRLVVAESVLLAGAGGVLGLVAARAMMAGAVAMTPRDLPLVSSAAIDGRVVAFALALGVLSGLCAGLLPALRVNLAGGATVGCRTVAGDRGAERLRFGLVVAQVAVTLALLVSAVSMIRTFAALIGEPPGFVADGVVTFQAVTKYDPRDPGTGVRIQRELTEGIAAVPGVQAAGGVSAVPFSEWYAPFRIRLPGTEEMLRVRRQHTVGEYFAAMKIELEHGRAFDRRDTEGSEPVAIVSRALFERLGSTGSATEPMYVEVVGAGPDRSDLALRVVGVTGDVHHDARVRDEFVIYVPHAQLPGPLVEYAVRTTRSAAELEPLLRAVAADVDPRIALQRFDRLQHFVAQGWHLERSMAQVLGVLGAVALMLALVGVYGTVAYSTRARLPEMGVRKAFGAAPVALLRLTVGRGLTPVALGAVLGSFAAFELQRSVAAIVREIPVFDPTGHAIALLVFLAAALAACVLPARVAAAVDPVAILRQS